MIQEKIWNGLSQWGGAGLLLVVLVGTYRRNTSLSVLRVSVFLSLDGLLHGHGHVIHTSALLPVPVACLGLVTAGDLINP